MYIFTRKRCASLLVHLQTSTLNTQPLYVFQKNLRAVAYPYYPIPSFRLSPYFFFGAFGFFAFGFFAFGFFGAFGFLAAGFFAAFFGFFAAGFFYQLLDCRGYFWL